MCDTCGDLANSCQLLFHNQVLRCFLQLTVGKQQSRRPLLYPRVELLVPGHQLPLVVLQLVEHLVQLRCQSPDLVVGTTRACAGVAIAGIDSRNGCVHLFQRPKHATGDIQKQRYGNCRNQQATEDYHSDGVPSRGSEWLVRKANEEHADRHALTVPNRHIA
ncbi:hypothetical protein D3C73_1241180 [compost metagenome]